MYYGHEELICSSDRPAYIGIVVVVKSFKDYTAYIQQRTLPSLDSLVESGALHVPERKNWGQGERGNGRGEFQEMGLPFSVHELSTPAWHSGSTRQGFVGLVDWRGLPVNIISPSTFSHPARSAILVRFWSSFWLSNASTEETPSCFGNPAPTPGFHPSEHYIVTVSAFFLGTCRFGPTSSSAL